MPDTKLVRIYVSDFDRLDTARKRLQAETLTDMSIADAVKHLLDVFEAQDRQPHTHQDDVTDG